MNVPNNSDTTSSEGADDHGDGVPWREFYREAQQRLAAEPALVESSTLDARRIVEEAAGLEPAEFVLGLDELATVRGVARFDAMMQRRLAGEPLQYVLGRWGFRTLDLKVDDRVLIPRPETESVVEVALQELDRQARAGARDLIAVDLGAGSGAIALSLATERDNLAVYASEVSPEALAVARANLTGIGRAATRVGLFEGSWFDPLPSDLRGQVNVVVTNPPYVRTTDPLPDEVADWEPPLALFAGNDGLDAYRDIFAEAPRWVSSGGAVVAEIGEDQGSEVVALAESAGFVEVAVLPDLTGRDRIVRCRSAA